jgi:hypothetical protein
MHRLLEVEGSGAAAESAVWRLTRPAVEEPPVDL